jgi:hypothetical protein
VLKPFVMGEELMSSIIKSCPKCSGSAKQQRGVDGHHAAHFAVHQLAKGHPMLALFAAGCWWAASKLIGHGFRCTACGHEFRA